MNRIAQLATAYVADHCLIAQPPNRLYSVNSLNSIKSRLYFGKKSSSVKIGINSVQLKFRNVSDLKRCRSKGVLQYKRSYLVRAALPRSGTRSSCRISRRASRIPRGRRGRGSRPSPPPSRTDSRTNTPPGSAIPHTCTCQK